MNPFENAPIIHQPNLTAKWTLTCSPGRFMVCLSIENKDDLGIPPEQLMDIINQWAKHLKKTVKPSSEKVEIEKVDVILTFNESRSTWILTIKNETMKPIDDLMILIIIEAWMQSMKGGVNGKPT